MSTQPNLGRLINVVTTEEAEAIVRNTIKLIDESKLWSVDWALLQSFLAQCALQFPHSFDYVARVISWRLRTAVDIDKKLWRDISVQLIKQHAALGRDHEVAWALWLLKELNQKLQKSASDLILENCNPLTLCILAHFAANKLVTDNGVKHRLKELVSGSPHSGSYWPLTLEMTHLKIHDPNWTKEVVPAVLKSLHTASVSLIKWNAKPKVFETEATKEDRLPEFAIENAGPDYGEAVAAEDFEDLDQADFGDHF